MADYIERKAAIDALRTMQTYKLFEGHDLILIGQKLAMMEVMLLPSAVAVEVVRCRDCKYWHDAPAADGFNSCEMDALIRHESFFCANGERKDGEQNG